jgi:hypothetical protein
MGVKRASCIVCSRVVKQGEGAHWQRQVGEAAACSSGGCRQEQHAGDVAAAGGTSGRWLPAATPRAGHHQPFLDASHRYFSRPSSPRATVAPPGLSRRRATRSTSGAPLLGRPPPGALAWPAAGAHPHPRGGRPGGGQALRGGGETTGRCPCSAAPELESEDGVDLIWVEWRRRGDAVAAEGGRRWGEAE